MIDIKFMYELLGLIAAASVLAFMTDPVETELSRSAFERYKKKRKKARYSTRQTDIPLRENSDTSIDSL